MKRICVFVLIFLLLLCSAIAYTESNSRITFGNYSILIPPMDHFCFSSASPADIVRYSNFDGTTLDFYSLGACTDIDAALVKAVELSSNGKTEYSMVDTLAPKYCDTTVYVIMYDDYFDYNRTAVFVIDGAGYAIECTDADGRLSFSWLKDGWKKMLLSIEYVESAPADVSLDYSPLRNGCKGDDVAALQQRLIDLLYLDDGQADGLYGSKTENAVEFFQSSVGLNVTGIADADTQLKLFANDAPEAQMQVSHASIMLGSLGQTMWSVNGQEFYLEGNQTKTIKTPLGTYRFDALGEYIRIDN